MGYRNLRQCVRDLESIGELVRVNDPVDPHLEVAEIQRRVFAAGGPAILFTRVAGTPFPMLGNLFGTPGRIRYLFQDTLETVKRISRLQVDPADALRRPRLYLTAPWWAMRARPRWVRKAPVLACETKIDQLPQLKSWPDDGGAYITLPQVYTEDPDEPGWARSNLGMYRVQLSGGRYAPNEEVGMHYQLHRGIAIHHAAAMRRGEPLRVNVYVGGPPAMTVAAVMPLPEGVSELSFAGLLGGQRVALARRGDGGLPILAEADFCIAGYLDMEKRLPEGPFGDHLGYYSLAHDFPVMRVEHVYHRADAIWPFTVVGRPPQEDALFADFVHEMAEPLIPKTVPGVQAVHAVQAAGVHPLLLALGSERYVPYEPRRPRELQTIAHALLGEGQLSLAKYLLLAAWEDNPELDVYDVPGFFQHVLERVDWRQDLHFHTRTTADTLDYTGSGLNEGSKLVIVAAGEKRRQLPAELNPQVRLPESMGFRDPRLVLPGVLVVAGPPWHGDATPFSTKQPSGSGWPEGTLRSDPAMFAFCRAFDAEDVICSYPLIVVVDDAAFASARLDNFLWTTFTRSNPATDVYGIEPLVRERHWGCFGSLVIDARAKAHHAPALREDPEVSRRVDALAAPGGPLHGVF